MFVSHKVDIEACHGDCQKKMLTAQNVVEFERMIHIYIKQNLTIKRVHVYAIREIFCL